jgi:DNA processing protein
MTGSAEGACGVTRSELRRVEGIGEAKSRGIHESIQQAAEEAKEQLERAAAAGATVLSWEDEAYPELLKVIHDPPVVLYVMGKLEARDLNAIGIVGSRRCSHYGREQAERFASLLAGAGFTVISGGARGIDSAAHRGAMRHPQGRTIAVLGSGVDVAYPPENAGLFKEIAERGCGAVVSEFPMGTPPSAENFPRRNRVVSGMSRGMFVVEADERSGALITARLAIEDHNRPVFALPGRVDNQMSAGPHKLIREGAVLVTKLEDIVEGLEPLPASVGEPMLFTDHEDVPVEEKEIAARAPVIAGLSDRQRAIVAQLDGEPVTVDQLVERSGFDAGVVLQELTFLSLKGVVKRVEGQTYARAAKR